MANRIKVHPAAELFPMMSDGEIDELADDIDANGLQQPIAIWSPTHDVRDLRNGNRMGIEFHLLDGRNRLAAIERLGLVEFSDDGWPVFDDLVFIDGKPPITVIGPEVDPFAYVVSSNIHRRHLTPEQKRELIAKLLKATPDKSNRQIAEQVKVDHKTVGAVRDDLEGRGEIPHVETVPDTKGRQQPTRKPRRAAEAATDAKPAAAMTIETPRPPEPMWDDDELRPSEPEPFVAEIAAKQLGPVPEFVTARWRRTDRPEPSRRRSSARCATSRTSTM